MYGIVDCNNFFVSCERVFAPKLWDKPVVVLSNNDGCAVAISNEAKALGIRRGDPLFKIQDIVDTHGVITLSGNHKLYGDMSSRVMMTLASIFPEIEIYSIDECFINLDGFPHDKLEEIAHQAVKLVRRHTGIPTCFGIAPTKTLAKVAVRFAKKFPGYKCVCSIDNEEKRLKALKLTEIGDVWGIGRRLSRRFDTLNIHNALSFAQMPLLQVKEIFNIPGERTWRELNGTPCVMDEYQEPDRKQICTSRSFSQMIENEEKLEEAVSAFVTIAAQKLREQNGFASSVTVFLQTNRFRDDLPQHFGSTIVSLDEPLNDTMSLCRAAIEGLHKIFRNGYKYKRAGILFPEIVRAENVVHSLFVEDDTRIKRQRVMKVLDEINNSQTMYDKVHVASHVPMSDIVKQLARSPLYSTHFDEIITVKV